MMQHWTGRLLRIGTFAAASLVLCGAAQDREVESNSTATQVRTNTSLSATAKSAGIASIASEQIEPDALLPSKAIQEILKLMDAGVTKEVIKAYVENATNTYSPSAADMITLKQHGIPDDITMALLKRSEEVPPRKPLASVNQGAPVSAAQYDVRHFPDPESYEYFQYYYLYPRTLASANERLGLYSGPDFSSYYGTFGWYSPRGVYFGNHRGVYSR